MTNLIFISSLVDEEQNEKINFSLAGQLYQQKMIAAYSFKKIFSFNIHSSQFKTIHSKGKIHYYSYPSKRIMRLFYFFHFAISVSKSSASKDAFLFYNLTNRNLITLLYLKYVKRQKVYVLVADYAAPQKNFISSIFHFVLKRTAGLLVLNNNIQLHSNTVVQELLLSEQNNKPITPTEEDKFSILFSGSIGRTTGIHIAITAMQNLPEYTLHISGQLFDISKEEMDKMLLNASNNIIYHRVLDRENYIQLLNKCQTCLSLRDPNSDDHLYNFPSKIGEYLSYNKRVISSLQYKGFENYILKTEWNPNVLANTIRNSQQSQNVTTWLYSNFGFSKFQENISKLVGHPENKILIITCIPSFYKTLLLKELSKKADVKVFFTDNSTIKREQNFFSSSEDVTTIKKQKSTFSNLINILKAGFTSERVYYNGWDDILFWLAAFFIPKRKNFLILESCVYEYSNRSLKKKLLNFLKRRFLERITICLASGEPHKLLLERLKFKGKTIITGSVGVMDFNYTPIKVSASEEIKKFLYIGRISKSKGIETLLTAFQKNASIHLYLAGSIDDDYKVEFPQNSTYLGYKNREDLKELFESNNVLVLPSLIEPWGLVVEEALYHHLPVIVSDKVGCNIDIVKKYDVGFVFEAGDVKSLEQAIIKIVEPNVYKRFRENTMNIDFAERKQHYINSFLQQ